jgi:23S rRNA (cytosine1962-C5)-methyltransferase
MWIAENWKDYKLLDTSDGERLEKWGKYILVRPDPQVIWKTEKELPEWKNAHGIYNRSSSGGGGWRVNKLPKEWNVSYGDLNFVLRPMGFKHTGLFPEQAVNWDWFSGLIKSCPYHVNVLNLFAYTGGATIAAAAAGASVCHVDAAKGMVSQAKENAALSGLADAPIRYIVDDCKKFVEREIRRGHKYEAIIMDPPSYGRGPTGEVWKIEDSIDDFVSLTSMVLSDKPLFFLLNSYTTGLSMTVLENILRLTVNKKKEGTISSDELGLPMKDSNLILPCGIYARWEK